ncbi:diamine acetyltransferase 1-like [Nilaparvata lugens]|uniref:diamine acetyltransferase 1-like n=1 Tax=Nilaparvata lugens TaxID=108931 RepID=UPI00193E9021|nr:diamine acetyltransferase 1-like [Nilaparvata lugens]
MYKFEDITVGENYVIREARRKDCVQIREMIKDLARVLGVPGNYPEYDVKTLEINGFDTNPPAFKCLVVEYKNRKTNLNNGFDSQNENDCTLVGYAFFFYTFSSLSGKEMFLEDFYIMEEHQGKGLGTKLFDSVVEVALNTNCSNMAFLVYDGNPVNNFYKRRGAINQTKEDKLHYCLIEYEQLIKLQQKRVINGKTIVEK